MLRKSVIPAIVAVVFLFGCGGGTESGDTLNEDSSVGYDMAVGDEGVPSDQSTPRDVAVADAADAVADSAVTDVSDVMVDTTPPAELESIEVTPARVTITVGESQPFAATGHYADGGTKDLTAEASWRAFDFGVATISNTTGSQGLATAHGVGITTVEATIGDLKGTAELTVDPAVLESVDISPADGSIPKWTTQQFQAMGNYSDGSAADISWLVAWSSSDDTIATFAVAGTAGVISGVEVGSVTVTATDPDSGIYGTVEFSVQDASLESISVESDEASMPAGSTMRFVARGTFAGGVSMPMSSGVVWSSSDEAVATVSNEPDTFGEVSARAEGNAEITATSGKVDGSAGITVTAATLGEIHVMPDTDTIMANGTAQFTVSGIYTDYSIVDLTQQATWSSNSSAATVSDAAGTKGLATGEYLGTAYIRADFGGLYDFAQLTIKRARGDTCYDTGECYYGFCEKPSIYAPSGFCCDTACPDNSGCQHCAWGDCRPVEKGTDPVGECDNYYCDGTGHCGSTCANEGYNCSSSCKNSWCWDSECLDRMPHGSPCLGNCQCQSNLCLFWRCT